MCTINEYRVYTFHIQGFLGACEVGSPFLSPRGHIFNAREESWSSFFSRLKTRDRNLAITTTSYPYFPRILHVDTCELQGTWQHLCISYEWFQLWPKQYMLFFHMVCRDSLKLIDCNIRNNLPLNNIYYNVTISIFFIL